MTQLLLTGRNAKILAEEVIPSDLDACIIAVDERGKQMALKLNHPAIIAGKVYTHAVVGARLASDDLSALLRKGLLGCAVTLVPEERFDPAKPFDLSWWRGGAAAITSVRLE